MNSISKLLRDIKEGPEANNYKVGTPVKGVKAIIPSKNGKEEAGLVVYKRKAEYRFNA